MALVVDEAITVTEDELGRKALGDLAHARPALRRRAARR